MSPQQMRNNLKAAYNNNPKWSAKVDKMSEGQLVAVYSRLKNQGKVT